MEPSDSELVLKCLEAKEAFAELYRRHAPPVYAFLKGMHRGDEHAAADSLQETFLRAFNALRRFDRSRPLRPWLLTIAGNVARDVLARSKKVQYRAEVPDRPSGEQPIPETVATNEVCFTLLDRVAPRVSPRAVAAFLLARCQGLSYSEIATINECSQATVKRDLADAMAALSGAAAEMGLV
ncbi:MAG TPA: sigma-70 family RNA polymerase sigma factor [Planctomycetota bacterium]|nr:sigma-70 family RNA polymerase sigma factor [Planctomycetota bacterium]